MLAGGIDFLHLALTFTGGWAACCAFMFLAALIDDAREALFDFAERKLVEDAGSYAPHGDIAFVPADYFKGSHFETNSGGAQHDHA